MCCLALSGETNRDTQNPNKKNLKKTKELLEVVTVLFIGSQKSLMRRKLRRSFAHLCISGEAATSFEMITYLAWFVHRLVFSRSVTMLASLTCRPMMVKLWKHGSVAVHCDLQHQVLEGEFVEEVWMNFS